MVTSILLLVAAFVIFLAGAILFVRDTAHRHGIVLGCIAVALVLLVVALLSACA